MRPTTSLYPTTKTFLERALQVALTLVPTTSMPQIPSKMVLVCSLVALTALLRTTILLRTTTTALATLSLAQGAADARTIPMEMVKLDQLIFWTSWWPLDRLALISD